VETRNVKYEIFSGAGNDFVMINNIEHIIPFDRESELTSDICGKLFKDIDGVIFLEKPERSEASIRMNYFNRDGSYGAMCGNGARCITVFAYEQSFINEKTFNIEAVKRIYKTEILGDNKVCISFPPPISVKTGLNTEADFGNGKVQVELNWIHVGSEHLVIFISRNEDIFGIKNLDEAKINEWGRVLRYHKDFQPAGANVNFVQLLSGNEIRVRTYERGVERETLACGTGIISSAIISNLLLNIKPPVKVLSQSKEWLIVNFLNENGELGNISLEGSAKKIGEGSIRIDSENYTVLDQK
jgi:diaminopimelate epimerase